MEQLDTTKNYLKRFTGTPSLIRLITTKDVPVYSQNASVQQKLSILNSGAVSFISINKDKEVLESLNFDIEVSSALDIINKIARYFSNEVDNKRYPIVGSYDLTITNTDGSSFFYDGSLNNNFTIDGENISECIRRVLNLPQLFVFEDSGLKKDINCFEIKLFKDDESVVINRNNGVLYYEYMGNHIQIKSNNAINSFLDKYNEKIDDNFRYSSIVGEAWEYEIKAKYSYGEDLCFGGTLTRAPYFFKEMLNTIRSIIMDNCFGKMLLEEKKQSSNNKHGIALVSSSDLSYAKWFKFANLSLEKSDVVLVDVGGDFIIGKVNKVEKNPSYSGYEYMTNGKIIKKF